MTPLLVSQPAEIPLDRRQHAIVFGLLILATAFSTIDRQVLGLLLEPIRHEFGLSDTQLGVLSGPAFTVLYATLALPLALLSDRTSRRAVLAGCVAAFGAMCAICGLASSFNLLLLARMGVAIGEAGAVPSSQAMVAVITPPRQLTAAMSRLYLSGSVGSILAFLIGGALAAEVGWRMTFVAVGAPGVLIAIALLTILPPQRKAAPRADGRATAAMPLRKALSVLAKTPTFRNVTFANACSHMATVAVTLWAGPYIARVYHLGAMQIGILLAVILGLSGAVGLFVIGAIAQRAGNRDPRWILWTVAISLSLAVPVSLVAYFAQSGAIALGAACLLAFLTVSIQGPAASVVQMVVGGSMRSVTVAVKHLIVTALGASLGPVIVGVANDRLAPTFGDEAIRYTFAANSGFWGLGALLFVYASRSFVADIERLKTQDHEGLGADPK